MNRKEHKPLAFIKKMNEDKNRVYRFTQDKKINPFPSSNITSFAGIYVIDFNHFNTF